MFTAEIGACYGYLFNHEKDGVNHEMLLLQPSPRNAIYKKKHASIVFVPRGDQKQFCKSILFKYDVDRSTMHSKFDPTGVQTDL